MTIDPLTVSAALTTSFALFLVLRLAVPPPKRLRGRLEPYLSPRLTDLNGRRASGRFQTVFGPIIGDAARIIGRVLDRTGNAVTVIKLRQAGWFRGLPEEELLTAYRVRQLRDVMVFGSLAVLLGWVLSAAIPVRAVLLVLGLVAGATRARGSLEKAIDARRELLKIEIYTVNQLLAMRVRAGGGVIQSVRSICERGSGLVVGELEEALRLHRSGWGGADAFRRIAELSPEPFCSRSYRLLATAEDRGADLGAALLALAEDVRETRRESIKRSATKRRAAMLVPTVAILAPVLILFVAAPLPYLITSWQ